MTTVNKNPSPNDLRAFGRAMLLGFGILGLLFWYFGLRGAGWLPADWGWNGSGRHVTAAVFWGLGLVLFILGFIPGVCRPVYVGWMTVAFKIGGVMTVVMLTVLYFTLLPVFSLIRFWDPLRLKLRPDLDTYWEDHPPHEATLERTMRPF